MNMFKQCFGAIGMVVIAASLGLAQSKEMELQLRYLPFDSDYFTEIGMTHYILMERGRVEELKQQQMISRGMLDKKKRELQLAQAQLDELRDKLAAFGSIEGFIEVGKDLAKRKIMLEIELAGVQARQKSLLAAAKQSKPEIDELQVKKLRVIQAIHEQKKAKLKQITFLVESGTVSVSAVEAAKSELLNAEVRLLEHQHQLNASKRGDATTRAQLLAVSIDGAQLSAQLSLVKQKLKQWSALYADYSKYAELKSLLIPSHMAQYQRLEGEKATLDSRVIFESMHLERKNRELNEFRKNKKKQESAKSDSSKAEKAKNKRP